MDRVAPVLQRMNPTKEVDRSEISKKTDLHR